ncbi:MAG: hypothetical protein JRM86_01720 [Nitrososphaerota archaeon]|nr:hypothetical protein [Nitrososphaerota archaeon]MDG6979423.1 hypothetical protein [Nitrososphaerota archaeon]MDG7005634.1 hypothetical protein [Nitrososphaerota archaeon]
MAVLIIGAVGAGVYLSRPSHQSSTTTSSAVVNPFKITYMSLIVGYNGGLFQLSFRDTSGKPILGIVTVLYTKTQAVLCTGASGSMSFTNCLPGAAKSYTYTPPAGGSLAANSSFSGYDSGAGPGSAIPGQGYTLTIKAWYADNSVVTENFTVSATAGS